MYAALAGERVVLVASNGGNSLDGYARELAARLRVPAVPAPGSTGSFGHALLSRESRERACTDLDLVRRLRRLEAPLLHFTSQHLARYGPLVGTPYVVTVHDLIRLSDWQLRREREPLVHRPNVRDGLLMGADARGIRRAAAVLAVSESTAGELRSRLRIPEKRLHVVPEGVDTSRFRPAAPPPGVCRYLLFVGSEQPRKNLRTLVRAVAALTCDPRHADLRLVKVGGPGGPEAPYRQRFLEEVHAAGVADRLVLPGRVTHDELLSWYSGAECLVLPSLAEGFGLPVLEAMACGCPVVVSADTAQAEVGGFAAACYRPVTDASALAAAIRRVLDAPRYREELRRRGFRRARQLSWERTVERTQAVYASVLGASGAPAEPAASSGGRHPGRMPPPVCHGLNASKATRPGWKMRFRRRPLRAPNRAATAAWAGPAPAVRINLYLVSKSLASDLSIGELVKATGVGEATLRAWERRFGFPQPHRQPSGHRRYARHEVERVLHVLEERKRGIALPVAIERARTAAAGVPSLFARLRARRPDLQPMTIRKRHLVHLARAIEEESAARAERALLLGSFQRERFYRQSEQRWRELAQGTEQAFVFADFKRLRRPRGRPAEIPVDRSHPVSREWGLVCEAPEHGACMIGWEPPGRTPSSDAEREFEVLLSVEPAVVREAAEAAAAIAAPLAPDIAEAARRLLEALPAPLAESQLRLASGVTARLLSAMR